MASSRESSKAEEEEKPMESKENNPIRNEETKSKNTMAPNPSTGRYYDYAIKRIGKRYREISAGKQEVSMHFSGGFVWSRERERERERLWRLLFLVGFEVPNGERIEDEKVEREGEWCVSICVCCLRQGM